MVATNKPVGLPAPSRSIWPPKGLGVSLFQPSTRKPARLIQARSYKCMIMAGVSPVAALISSNVGKRFSANCAQVQPPITCTQCGEGVRCAWMRKISRPWLSDDKPSQRTSIE